MFSKDFTADKQKPELVWERVKSIDLYKLLHRDMNWYLLQHWLIVWCLTAFSTVFQLYHSSQCTYPCFPGVLLTNTPDNILSKPMAAFPQNHCRNYRQPWERNESWCTIINHQKEYWPSWGSNQQLPILRSTTLRTEICGSARNSPKGVNRCKVKTFSLPLRRNVVL